MTEIVDSYLGTADSAFYQNLVSGGHGEDIARDSIFSPNNIGEYSATACSRFSYPATVSEEQETGAHETYRYKTHTVCLWR